MLLRTLFTVLVAAACGYAQMTNGSISGTLVDGQGAVIPQAKITLKNTQRDLTQTQSTDTAGNFVFPSLPPGTYELTFTATGFKTLERKDVVVLVNQRLTLGEISLALGQVTEVVEVKGEAITLKTESAERANQIDAKQMENIAVNGRSYLGLAFLTPGVVSNANFQVAGTGGLGAISANGSRYNQNQLLLNGISNVDTGNNGDQLATVSLDSVQEFRILTGSYQAEYGRSAGAQIIVQTKSGSRDFHGSAYYFRRHDSLNANTWLRNNLVTRQFVDGRFQDIVGQPRQLYRFNYPGYTIGGPIFIPKILSRERSKLFFFWSQEYQRQLQPEAPRRITVPTALERNGDFSQSLNNQGQPLGAIRDPLSGLPFPDARIPQSRIWAPGRALLNLLPTPNQEQRTFLNYNYETQISTRRPRREDLLRVDYNVTDNVRVWGHWVNNNNIFTSPYGSFVLGSNVGAFLIDDGRPGKSYAGGMNYTISPTMTAEVTVGWGRNDILIEPNAANADALSRTRTGINMPLLYPEAVQRDFIPVFTFNGTRLANSPGFGTGNAPFVNYNDTTDINANTTKVASKHVFKFGMYLQRSRKDQTSFANANGNYNFGDNPQNPLDTNFGYSNALLGVYNSFTQARAYANGQYRYYNIEWYAQDTWKITRRLTLDYGMRMAWIQPQHDSSRIVSSFRPDRFRADEASRLFEPQRNAAGATIGGIDPVTGQTTSVVNIGRLIPGTGNLLNGIVLPGKDANRYLMRDRGIHWGPRFGLAFDMLGNQRVVLRTGGGIFYDRFQGNRVFDLLTNPPTVLQPTLNFGFAQEINPATALLGPPNLVMADPTGVVPTTYSYNFGIQARLPFDYVLDIAYVGNMARHLQNNRNINAVPYGAFFRNPTAFNADFLRPFRGFGNINVYEGTITSNFNSLQVTASRRFRSFQMDLNYTWGKALGTNTGDGDFARIDSLHRFANYSYLDFHRKHNMNINFIYELPKFAKSRALGYALNNWQISGIYTYTSGSPQGVGFSIPGFVNQNVTGSFTEGARARLVGDPTQGVGGTIFEKINPAAFLPPQVGSIGVEQSPRIVFLPPINNWNMTFQKSFPVREGMNFQLRADAFNFFNHTQFSDFNRTVNFANLQSTTATNFTRALGGFGAVNGVRDPRIMQLVVRFVF